MESNLQFGGELGQPRLIRATDPASVRQIHIPGIGRVWFTKDEGGSKLPGHMIFASDLKMDHIGPDGGIKQHLELGSGVVTTAGVNYMAADFLAGSANRINAFNFQDSGTGVTAEAIGQTALVTPAGPARVSGTQSNPTANQYRSVATIAYTATLAITEWGLFSAATVGTLFDRRLFAAVNVLNGDSVQYTYTLSIIAGG